MHRLFEKLGFPHAVATCLTCLTFLCCTLRLCAYEQRMCICQPMCIQDDGTYHKSGFEPRNVPIIYPIEDQDTLNESICAWMRPRKSHMPFFFLVIGSPMAFLRSGDLGKSLDPATWQWAEVRWCFETVAG